MIIMGGVEIKSTETQVDNLAMFFYAIATVQIQQLTASPFLMSKNLGYRRCNYYRFCKILKKLLD